MHGGGIVMKLLKEGQKGKNVSRGTKGEMHEDRQKDENAEKIQLLEGEQKSENVSKKMKITR